MHSLRQLATTHILKPDHPQVDRYPHSVANEWFVMRLAAATGLPVPPVVMRHIPESVYLVQRFDRSGSGANARRLHALDACQLLSLSPVYKYEQATAQTLLPVRRDDVLAFGRVLGLPPPLGARLLDESAAAIEKHAAQLLEAHQASPDADPGEARLLRLIVHGPIRDMLAQLAGR